MSIDRPGDPSGSAGSSSEPAKAQDDDKPNWKPVYAAIAIAVALTLATVLWINRPGAESADPPPSPAIAPSASTPTPTPSPTPDEREVAVTEAKQAYQSYTDAYSAMASGGSSKTLVEQVHPYTTGRNWETVKKEAEGYREGELKITGGLEIAFLGEARVDLDEKPPIIRLKVCVDPTKVEVKDKSGKSLDADWVRSEVTMIKKEDSWKVEDRDDTIERKSCAN